MLQTILLFFFEHERVAYVVWPDRQISLACPDLQNFYGLLRYHIQDGWLARGFCPIPDGQDSFIYSALLDRMLPDLLAAQPPAETSLR